MADNSFHFIVSNGPKVPKDPALRTLIRKQAMKDVGIARKKRGGYGRVNLLQPVAHESTNVQNGSSDSSTSASTLSSNSTNSSTSPESDDQTRETSTDATTLDDEQLLLLKQAPQWLSNHHWKLPLNGPPATNFERLRMKYHFDIRDLSVLTSFNIGKSTMLAISENPELLTTLLGSQMQSYLQYIPSRYGHKPYLTAVVDCVSAKVHSKLYPRNDMFEGMILKMYAKALASLQCAVSGDESSLDPDLLCAIQMLSLHEMLDPTRTEAYGHHIDGSALVVKRRTPSRFKTDYEKMLFHAHIGPTFTEALWRNEACYLEQPQWMRLYESLIEETPWLTDRSAVVIRIRMRLLSLCSMLPDTMKALDPDKSDGGLLLTIELKARANHAALLKALEDYKAHIVRTSMAHAPQSELALRREVFGTALECLCIYKRIISSFCDEERVTLEAEAQDLATRIFDLQNQPAPRHSWIYSQHEKGTAGVIQMTQDEWEKDLSFASPSEKRRIAYERWANFNRYLHGHDEFPYRKPPGFKPSEADISGAE